jgi:cytochrome c peroxidase
VIRRLSIVVALAAGCLPPVLTDVDLAKLETLVAAELPQQTASDVRFDVCDLGRDLYFEPALSANGEISCASCHEYALGGDDPDGGMTSAHVSGFTGTNAPTTWGVGHRHADFGWHGQNATLTEQVLIPLQKLHQVEADAVLEVAALPAYAARWDAAVTDSGVDPVESLANIIANYVRFIPSPPTRLGAYLDGQADLSDEAVHGAKLYLGKGGCDLCHSGPTQSDGLYHNLGVPSLDPANADEGRFKVSQDEADLGRFRTPSLELVGMTAPYMHNGSMASLTEVVEHYSWGGETPDVGDVDELLVRSELTKAEVDALVAFLTEAFEPVVALEERPPCP